MAESKRLSEKSIAVLSLIAEGHSYSQIVDGHQEISYHDIFNAAEEALRLAEPESDYHKRMAVIKSRYPRAYEKWSEREDADLQSMHEQRVTVAKIATQFERQPSAIRSRLEKLK